ncbi:hypothetical protein F480_00355 [Bibersteinia trehalosi Y31]|uniref:Putative tail fiber protein gp53-like C-terminal domain-containing protein n=1 Tax=Bibersteinia trehalosi Y31 TaxID=1261658 RepID=A0A179D204_BIBTR|nr:hypothetical protein [Bibersteinia trehalosi]OAQ15787.1 hypothetical protein F480_00355 [Bibersteinia trehalosi Y31]
MANFRKEAIWHDGIYQLKRTDPVVGGEGGTSNKPLKELADRTEYLNQRIDDFNDAITAPDGYRVVGQAESVAELRTVEPTEPNQHILVRSYYEGMNKGGGTFYHDATDTTSADDGGVVIVTAGGNRWKRINTQVLTLDQFGVKPKTESAALINAAIKAVDSGGWVIVPHGEYLVGDEIKLKANMGFFGIGNPTIKSVDGTSPLQNTITTINNDRSYHSNYVDNITVKDLTIDGNWQNRSNSISAANQGCCLKIVTARNFLVENVTAKNGVLHCFDVAASNYFDDGNINHTAEGPSEYGIFRNCKAYNSKRDDAFTTHNSGFIKFENCYAEFDRSLYEKNLQVNNHGFEADEGSYNIHFLNCYTKGYFSGYQVKGHDTTMPAHNVVIENCVSDNCTLGIQIVHIGVSAVKDGQTHCAENVIVKNHTIKNLVPTPNVDYPTQFIRIRGYWNVRVDNLVTENSGNAYIAILEEANNIVIDGVELLTASTATQGALIWVYSSSIGRVDVRNVVSKVPQPVPIVQKSSRSNIINIDGIYAKGALNGAPLVKISVNHGDSIRNIGASINWSSKVQVINENNAELGSDTVEVELSNRGIFTLSGGTSVDSLAGFSGCYYHHKSGYTYIYDTATASYIRQQRKIDSGLVVKKDSTWENPALHFSGFNNSDSHIVSDKGKYIRFGQIDDEGVITETVGISTNGWLVPLVDNQYKLGQSNLKWAELLVTPPLDSNGDIGVTTRWVRSLFPQSLTGNGWQKLSGGLIIQWGTYNANAESTFNFPIAFTRECFVVIPVDYNTSGSNLVDLTGTNKTATSFQILSQGGDIGVFSMVAIGV